MSTYRRARDLMERGAAAYRLAESDQRRLLIRAFVSRIEIDVDNEQATLASPFMELKRAAAESKTRSHTGITVDKLSQRRVKITNPGAQSWGRGSTMNSLVELAGIAPASAELLASALQVYSV